MCSSRQLAALISAYDSTHKAYVPDEIKKARARLKKQVYNRERFRLKRCHHQAELQTLQNEIRELEHRAKELAYFKRSSLPWKDIAAVFKQERQLSEHQNLDLKAQIEQHKEQCRMLLSCAKVNLGDHQQLPQEILEIENAVMKKSHAIVDTNNTMTPFPLPTMDPLDAMLESMDHILQEPFSTYSSTSCTSVC
ncbi:hypothetical protein THRCLA_02614 [Thraustotheca clavata]|uniref:BZIP domain-containing protein n=1 Tax=Thraustotheca clavata TaxID=74557 RepID=A0A1W0A4L4_9STRA|nr:hypothetical protein THRCLA_02614 [Thraustotheca clavata]